MSYLEDPKSNTKTFYFRQSHISGYKRRRFDYFFVSNTLQESTKNTDILASLSTDHSSKSFILIGLEIIAKGKGFWIYNSSLTLNKKMNEHISTC